jgi:peptide/nickel transport system substrate-binding protein
LLSGEVDVVNDLPVQDIARLGQTPGISVNTGEENRVIFLVFNVANNPLRSADIRDRNPFANRAVRQPINGAINREAVTRVVLRGQGQLIGFMGTRFINGHKEALTAVQRSGRQHGARRGRIPSPRPFFKFGRFRKS